MLYSEFLEGTGCRDNAHNYNLYKELEIIYMNTDCTKEHIYTYGKKLADNSKSETQINFENERKAEIEYHEREIERHKNDIDFYQILLKYEQENEQNKADMKHYRNMIKYNREEIKAHRVKIREQKWLLKNCNYDSCEA